MFPMHLIAICPEELTGLVAEELKDFGADDIRIKFKAVHFQVSSYEDYLRAHLYLKIPSRLLRVVAQLKATHFDVLKKGASEIPWEDYFRSQSSFRIEGVPAHRGAKLMKANDISRAVREAIQGYYRESKFSSKEPKVDIHEPQVELVAFVENNHCTLSIDSSKKSLHKRGYRREDHPAPIKETLAAAILRVVGYDGSKVFFDPMCGSGTLAIEAAFVALDKSPLIHRKKGEFGFEWLNDFDNGIWRKVQDETRKEKKTAPQKMIFASDVSKKFVEATKKNALNARVEKFMTTSCQDFFEAQAPAHEGVLVCNLPYGERISSDHEMSDFYKKIGDKLKLDYKGWQAWLLVSAETPYKKIGLHPSKKVTLLNGGVPVKLLKFELYDGSKKASKSKQH